MSETPTLSIAVCTYNRADVLPKCLESLVDQTTTPELFEVLIVDNNSTDETKKIADDFCGKNTNFKYIFEEKQGLSQARNRAIAEAKGKFLAYIDDDAIADREWVKNILDAIKTDSSMVAFGGPIYPWYNSEKPKWFKDEFEIFSLGEQIFQLNEENHPFGLIGPNMIFKKEILNKYNGFSAKYGMNGDKIAFGEESLLFYRMIKEKENIQYFPSIKVLHLVSDKKYSLKNAFQRSSMNGRAIAQIREAKLSSIDFIKKFIRLTLSLLEVSFLFIPSLFSKAIIYKKLQKLGYFYGYVAEIATCGK